MAEWIEIGQSSVMVNRVDKSERVVNIVHTLGGPQETWFLTEDGLYEVLMQSRKRINGPVISVTGHVDTTNIQWVRLPPDSFLLEAKNGLVG